MRLTIVIATYNSAKTLRQTLDSIRYQSFNNIETIVIDNLSTDKTLDIVDEYSDVVNVCISEKDTGIYCAFNKGIKHATGDFICFIGSDDCYCDYNVLENIMLSINENDAIISAPIIAVNEDNKKESFLNNKISTEEILSGLMLPHPGLFVRTDIMRQYKFNETNKIISDYEFLLRYLLDNGRVKFVDQIVAYFSDGGISSSAVGSHNWNRTLYEHIVLLEKLDLVDSQLDLLIERFCGFKKNNTIRHHLREVRRLICKKIPILNFMNNYIRKIKSLIPSKKRHQCSLKYCRWCNRLR